MNLRIMLLQHNAWLVQQAVEAYQLKRDEYPELVDAVNALSQVCSSHAAGVLQEYMLLLEGIAQALLENGDATELMEEYARWRGKENDGQWRVVAKWKPDIKAKTHQERLQALLENPETLNELARILRAKGHDV